MSKWDDILIEQQQADALNYMGEAEWRDMFEERHGWAPDCDYEVIEQIGLEELYGKEPGVQNQNGGWDIKISEGPSD